MKTIKIKIVILTGFCVISYLGIMKTLEFLKEQNHKEKVAEINKRRNKLKENLSSTFGQTSNIWPKEYSAEGQNYNIEYTFDEKLSKFVKKILKRYRSDYSAVIVIDNDSGMILSAVGYQREGNQFNSSLPFSSTHPSASLFKIITSAALLESKKVDKNTVFNYRGKGTTLYKYQLLDKRTRWTRYLTFKKAFALSNNVIFGKAAISNIRGEDLYNQAIDFGFNTELMDELDLSKSIIRLPRDQYNMAEIASGFNKDTMISPLHGAVLSSVIANDGVMRKPYLVKGVVNTKSGENIWKHGVEHVAGPKKILSEGTISQLKELMETTIKKGTARGSFRKLRRKLKGQLRIGGKTGSITGGLPYGKRDWFTAYAMPKNKDKGKGISICVMNVNVNKWYVKSTFLVKSIIEYYYKEVFDKGPSGKSKFVSSKRRIDNSKI